MGATRSVSWMARGAWLLVALLVAVRAATVPAQGGRKHRRQSPFSPAQPFIDIDKQFAAVGSHHHHQQHAATGAKLAFRQPEPGHSAAAAETTHGARKQHHGAAPQPLSKHHPAVHRVGPKSLRRDSEAQSAASDHVAKAASGHDSSGKTHEHSAAKRTGGGGGEHHHYQHHRGEDERQHRARDYGEAEGAKTRYDHDDFHQAGHGASAHGGHHGKHAESSHRGKGGFSKGFRDKYHKDESHKLNKYWSNGHEKGAFEKFGLHNSHYLNSDRDKAKKSQHKEGKKSDGYAKKGQSGKGHSEGASKGHRAHGGHESQRGHHEDYSKKAGRAVGSAHDFQHGGVKA
ncbi:cation channel sperm-associated protein 1-like [Bacillus rossius redtenbacheri]|uniref:cation channel sperm-associated protein 1-like n=1 Tax=Bacillus rossius redtenbacheri TaxID=93214 RepID=UPI002FDCE2C6